MPIAASDIAVRLSVPSATQGGTTAQANPNNSLGKYVSTTVMADNTTGNLFDDVSGDENAAGTVDYRCLFVHNTHLTLTLQNAVVYVSSEVAGGAAVAVAVDTTAVASYAPGTTAVQALTATTEIAPGASVTGLAYSTPTTRAAGLALGNVGPGQVKAFWVRRTALASAALANDGATFAVSGDTAA